VSPRLAACLLLLWSATPASADWLGLQFQSPLTTAQDIREASGRGDVHGLPVRITGVVTHINPEQKDFWVQDESAGIHVLPHDGAAALQQGDRVEIEGFADRGDFAPCVAAQKLTRLGPGEMPEPMPFDLSVEDARWLDAQWVQAWVVIRGAYTKAGTTRLDVFTSHGCGTLVVPGEQWAPAAGSLRDVAVTVRGVCVPTFKNRLICGPPKIYISSLPQVPRGSPDVIGGPNAPARVIDHLLRFAPAPHPGIRRVKIAGVVTAAPLPGVLVVQDQTGGAMVWTDDPSVAIPVGTAVEAFGLLRIDGHRVGLARAKVKIVGPAPFPTAVGADPRELAAGTRDAQLVKLSGRVEDVRAVGKWTAVTLTDGAFRFEAYVPGSPGQNRLVGLAFGSKVEIAGVPVAVAPDGNTAPAPGVFLRGPEAISHLEDPPPPARAAQSSWWTTTRIASFGGGFLAVSLVGGAWVWTLRVRVRRAAAEIARQYEEKARLEQQLRQAAKLEAVGRLAGGIAHDFNNLLTVINGCAELLAAETEGESQRAVELTDDIRRAGDRAAALTGQLLTFSRKREVLISPVNLNEIVTDTARLLNRVIGEDIRVEVRLAADLPAVRAEPGLLHQVIMNLAVNARDAMPRGGTLTLGTAFVLDVGEHGSSVPIGSAPRKYVRLTVSDTGVGMSDEVKARVFEPFFTTKELNKGTGLGLATVYGVVQSLGGKIRLDSAVGRGTTFQIDLRVHGDPLSDAELALPSTPLPASRVSPSTRLAGVSVLVVEDNDAVRNLVVAGLEADGATVVAAEQPDQALQVLAERTDAVDVLVTDVVMPGMSGRELADRVRVDRPDMRILFMSGYTADEVLRQGVLEDQVEFIQKPFTPDHLTGRLLRVLGRATDSAERVDAGHAR
jgi:two-component system cell cycle sensor histidine kinase/response regulator CckA